MKKFFKMSLIVSVVATTSAFAQPVGDIKAKTPYGAYMQDGRGVVTRSANGLCWRTGYWTSADAIPECEGEKPKAAVVVEPKTIEVSYEAKAFFDFDKAVVKPDSQARLDALVQDLDGVDVEWVIVIGHADSTGPTAYNQKLSERRADAVKSYLISKGVDPNKIRTEGKGETQPAADNATAAGRQKNRRVTVEVVGMAK